MTTELMPISGDIAPYNEFHGQVRQLKEENAKTIFDYEDATGNKAARSYIHKLRQTKGAVEKTRKELKAEYLEKGRKVDSEAKHLVSELDEMIEAHAKPLRAIEDREAARAAELQEAIDLLIRMGQPQGDSTAAELRSYQAELMEEPITEEDYAERIADAYAARDASYKRLGELADAAEKREAEQAELARLREAEAQRQREDEERRQKERDAELQREAEERTRKEAEEKAQREREEAERKAKEAADAAAKRELELKLQAERAEKEKAEAIQRERDRVAAEEKRKADEDAKREASRKHQAKIHGDIIRAFGDINISQEASRAIITAIRGGDVPHLKILY